MPGLGNAFPESTAVLELPTGELVIGGDFLAAGGITAKGLVKYDPSSGVWSMLSTAQLGPVSGRTDVPVSAIVRRANGEIVVGGLFASAGAVSASNIARYSPTTNTWSALGAGLNGRVNAIALLPNGDLIAGGVFTASGSTSVSRVAKFSFTTGTWTSLGAGCDNTVWALHVLADGSVLVGGEFLNAGGAPASRIARFQPSTAAWSSSVSQPNGSVFAFTNAVVSGSPVVFVGGSFTSISGFGPSLPANRLAIYDSTNNFIAPTSVGVSGTVSALTTLPNGDVAVGGSFGSADGLVDPANNIVRYAVGTGTFNALGSGVTGAYSGYPPSIDTLTVLANGDVIAAGFFRSAGTQIAQNIAKLSPGVATWSALGTGTDGPVESIAVMPNGEVYAGGHFNIIAGVQARYLAKYDPGLQSWSAVGTGSDSWINEIVPLPNGEIVIAGSFYFIGGITAPRIAVYSPTTGTFRGAGPILGNGFMNALFVLPNGDVAVGGDFEVQVSTPSGPQMAKNIARYSPTTQSWSALGSVPGIGVADREVNCIAIIPGGDLIAGGGFTNIGGIGANRIARYSLATGTWSALGAGTDYDVYALTVIPNGDVIVGGGFNTAGGISVNRVARYRPSTNTWSSTGATGITTNVTYSLHVLPTGDVLVGGGVPFPGATSPPNSISRYVPATNGWTTLGTGGVNSTVRCISSLPSGDVLLGGTFNLAGGNVSSYFARYSSGGTSPSVGTQPADVAVVSGQQAAFTIAATGSDVLTFQWRKNSNPINAAGNATAITPTLVLSSVTSNDAGQYDCIVTNICGTATSSVAGLTVLPRPLPDLLPSVSPLGLSEALTGQTLTVEWSVANSGTLATASGWTDRIVVSASSTGANPLVTVDLPAPRQLAISDQYTRSAQISLPAAAGTYYIVVTTDALNEVVELEAGGEANNRASSAPLLVRLRPTPDLQVTQVVPPSNGVLSSTQAQVTFTVANNGTGPTSAPSWGDSIFLLSSNQSLPLPPLLLSNVQSLGVFPNPSYLPANGPGVDGRYVQSVLVQLPHDITGDYRLAVYADSSPGGRLGTPFSVAELDESNNVMYSTPFHIDLEPQPDLQVTNVAPVGPTTVFSGQLMRVNRTVTNVDGPSPRGGRTDVGLWQDRLYLSLNTRSVIWPGDPNATDPRDIPADIPVGMDEQSGNGTLLNPGSAVTAQAMFNIPPSVSGLYYIKVATDVTNVVTEFGLEGNNVGVSVQQLDIRLSPAVDLVPASIAVSPVGALVPDQQVTVAWSVRNDGAPPPDFGQTWTDIVYLSSDAAIDPTDIEVGRASQSTTPPVTGSPNYSIPNYSKTVTFRIPRNIAAGSYQFIVKVNAGGDVYEGAGSANNTLATGPATGTPIERRLPDLVPQLTAAPPTTGATSGGAGQVAFRVSNDGTANTQVSDWVDRLYISQDNTFSGDDTQLAASIRSTSLAVGANYAGTLGFVLPTFTPGNYFLIFKTDAGDQVFEDSGDSNNALVIPYVVTLDVTDGPAADLRITAGTAPSAAASGIAIPVTWTGINSGTATTNRNNWTDRVYLSRSVTALLDAVEIGARTIPQAAAVGQTYSSSASCIIPPDASGAYFVVIAADADNTVLELNNSNNLGPTPPLPISVSLSPRPNLTIQSISVPSTAITGQPTGATAIIRNLGAATDPDANWQDSFYLSTDPFLDLSHDIYLGRSTHSGGLAADAQYTSAGDLRVPNGTAGLFYVLVRTDADNTVNEGDGEQDNVRASSSLVEVTLPPPSDLVVASVTPPASLTLGETASYQWQVGNIAGATASGVWSDALFLSPQPFWVPQAKRIGTFTPPVPRNIAVGSLAAASGAAATPGVTPGQYYVVTTTDVHDGVNELDETNNASPSSATVTVAIPMLPLGIVTHTTLAGGDKRYFEVARGSTTRPLRILVSASGGILEDLDATVRFGVMPEAGQFDLQTQLSQDRSSRSVVVPSSGTSRVFFRLSAGGTAAAADVQIVSEELITNIVSVTPSMLSSGTTVTLTVDGSGFSAHCHFSIVLPDGRELSARRTAFLSDTRAMVTISIPNDVAPVGTCTLQMRRLQYVYDADAGQLVRQERELFVATLPHSISIVSAAQVLPEPQFIVPPTARPNIPYPARLVITNSSNRDVAAPIIRLRAKNNAELRRLTVGATDWQHTFQMIPVGRIRPGYLTPGEVFSVSFECRSTSSGIADFAVDMLDAQKGAIPWMIMCPQLIIDASVESEAACSRLAARVGNTWPEFCQALRAAAARSQRGDWIDADEAMRALVINEQTDVNYEPPLVIHNPDLFKIPTYAQDLPRGDSSCCGLPVPEIPIPSSGLTNLTAFIGAFTGRYGLEAGSLFTDWYFNLRPAERVFSDQTSIVVRSFASNDQSDVAVKSVFELIKQRLKNRSVQSDLGITCESAAPMSVAVEAGVLGITEEQLNKNIEYAGFPSIASLIAGGVGEGGPPGGSYRRDRRDVRGSLSLVPRMRCGRLESIEIQFFPKVIVTDTLDFCPGNDGTLLELVAAVCTAQSREGYFHLAGDVPFKVEYSMPPLIYALQADELGCPPAKRKQLPWPDCDPPIAEPCQAIDYVVPGECHDHRYQTDVRASMDPNDKYGPEGYGVEHWVAGGQPLEYVVRFENVESAAAPANRVVIRDQLDLSLNPNSLRLGAIRVGGIDIPVPEDRIAWQGLVDATEHLGVFVEVSAGVDVGATPPEVFWSLQAIDPVTGAPIVDGARGLLPPENGMGDGQGSIAYRVQSRANVSSATVVSNRATIVFDANEPILTNEVRNTIDAGIPSSVMSAAATASTSSTGITLSAQGADASNGSGLRGIQFSVSANGSPYVPISGVVESGTLPFVGEKGNVYRFISQAVDNAGNIEPPRSMPDAMTTTLDAYLAATSDTGLIGDQVTNLRSPTLEIVSSPGAAADVRVIGNGFDITRQVTPDDTGRSLVNLSNLVDGGYQVSVTVDSVVATSSFTVETAKPLVTEYLSLQSHGSVGYAALVLDQDGATSEPASAGTTRVRVAFSEAMFASTIVSGGISLQGMNAATNQPLNLTGITSAIAAAADGLSCDVVFSPPLPDYARYCLTLGGLTDVAGNSPAGQVRVSWVALKGDVTNDRRVNATDVGALRSLIGTSPIVLTNVNQVRSDVNGDGAISQADLDIVMAARGRDARFAPSPCFPGRAPVMSFPPNLIAQALLLDGDMSPVRVRNSTVDGKRLELISVEEYLVATLRTQNRRGDRIATFSDGHGNDRAMLLPNGASEPLDLGTLGGRWSVATDLNESGQVTGYSETREREVHAFRFTPDLGMLDLDTLGVSQSKGLGLNDDGVVVGCFARPDPSTAAFSVKVDPPGQSLEGLGGSETVAEDLNGDELIVGMSMLPSEVSQAVVWTKETGVVNLNSLLPPAMGWSLERTTAVDENGVVTGLGTFQGHAVPFRFTFTIDSWRCVADANGSGGVTVDDLFVYFDRWFTGDPAADINDVSGVQVDDLFAFLDLWFTGCQ